MPPKKSQSPAKGASPAKQRGRPAKSSAAAQTSPDKTTTRASKISPAKASPSKVTKTTPKRAAKKPLMKSANTRSTWDDDQLGSDEGLEEDFIDTTDASGVVNGRAIQSFPNQQISRTPEKVKKLGATASGRNSSRKASSPKTKVSPSRQATAPKKNFDGRGFITSYTNPEMIGGQGNTKPNPFYEPMPGKEVWHRRMPHFFPFGETPWMEALMSRQINEDLNRSMSSLTDLSLSETDTEGEHPDITSNVEKPQPSKKGSRTKTAAPPSKHKEGPPLVLPTTWALPTITPEEINVLRGSPGARALTPKAPKRKGSVQAIDRQKRQRLSD